MVAPEGGVMEPGTEEHAKRCIRAMIGLQCGGGGPNEGESAQHFVDRLTNSIHRILSDNGYLPPGCGRPQVARTYE